MTPPNQTRVCVIGAGPGGLSFANCLRERGYTRVTVLESAGRVGGKCLSLTYGARTFDIGANYVTSDYRELLGLARKFGLSLYTEAKATIASFSDDSTAFAEPLSVLRRQASLGTLGSAVARYLWIRRRLQAVIDRPGFAGISRYPSLCQPFSDWLADHQLTVLTPMFEVPIADMGYGRLNEIPAAYALKYIGVKTFLDTVLVAVGLPTPWPKRFTDGFQRVWEHVAGRLDVQLNLRILEIERGETIRVTIERGAAREVLVFDRLVVASLLTERALAAFMHLSPAESALFRQVVVNPFVLTSFIVRGMRVPRQIVFVLPVPDSGMPSAMSQQFTDTPFWQFYTRLDRQSQPPSDVVMAAVRQRIAQLGGTIDEDDVHTYTTWDYFPHVDSAAIAAGFYDRLEALQGAQHTFYCGGLLAFELIEPIIRYSRHLAEAHF